MLNLAETYVHTAVGPLLIKSLNIHQHASHTVHKAFISVPEKNVWFNIKGLRFKENVQEVCRCHATRDGNESHIKSPK